MKAYFETTEEFVSAVNTLYRKRKLNKEVVNDFLKHLSETVVQGKIVDYVKTGEHAGIIEIRDIYDMKDVAQFLKVNSPVLKKLVSQHVLDYLCDIYFSSFEKATVPHRAYGEEGELQNANRYAKLTMNAISLFIKNQDVFTVESTQRFADAYVKSLFMRQKMPSLIMSNKYEMIQHNPPVLTRPAFIYKKMQGMHHFDMENLYILGRFLVEQGGNVKSIAKAVENLPLEHTIDASNDILLKYTEEKIYNLYKNLALNVIENSKKAKQDTKQTMKEKFKDIFTR